MICRIPVLYIEYACRGPESDRVQLHNADHVAQQSRHFLNLSSEFQRYASGCVVECRICSREVSGSNLGLGYFAPRYTQPSIPPGTVNEYQ